MRVRWTSIEPPKENTMFPKFIIVVTAACLAFAPAAIAQSTKSDRMGGAGGSKGAGAPEIADQAAGGGLSSNLPKTKTKTGTKNCSKGGVTVVCGDINNDGKN
jgi:hypothetical protein